MEEEDSNKTQQVKKKKKITHSEKEEVRRNFPSAGIYWNKLVNI